MGKHRGEKIMTRFLGRYGILIILSLLGIYAILAKLSVVHTPDFESLVTGFMVLVTVELLKIEYKLGQISGIISGLISDKKTK
jgi:hypothetical protein